MDCQNHLSKRAGEDGAWMFRSPHETDWDVPGRDLRLAQQELVVSGALNLTQMGLLHFSGVL